MMLRLYQPALEELWFRQQMMADPQTMSYNHAWGGTIPFPRESWAAWYERWVEHPEGKRFYRYAADQDTFVGEVAYHWDHEHEIWYADVIIHAPYRHRGYGRAALKMLCDAAKANGIDILRDDIAIDNPAVTLFLSEGFTEEYRTDEYIMLQKQLS